MIHPNKNSFNTCSTPLFTFNWYFLILMCVYLWIEKNVNQLLWYIFLLYLLWLLQKILVFLLIIESLNFFFLNYLEICSHYFFFTWQDSPVFSSSGKLLRCWLVFMKLFVEESQLIQVFSTSIQFLTKNLFFI